MRTPAILLALLLPAALAIAQTLATAAPAAAPTPAQWKTYDVLLVFRALPRSYSCDELRNKVRDVLLQLGARPSVTITPSDCGAKRSGAARSHNVEVKLQLPEALPGNATRAADTTVREQPVHLGPGAPDSLQANDCELMRQLQETLLAGLPVRIAASSFNCTAASKDFALTVDAPLPAHASDTPPT